MPLDDRWAAPQPPAQPTEGHGGLVLFSFITVPSENRTDPILRSDAPCAAFSLRHLLAL